MNIFLINETESDIVIHGSSTPVALHPGEKRMVAVPETGRLSINRDIVLTPQSDGNIEVTDDKVQVCGIGGEFLATYEVPDSADFAFSVVPPGDGDGEAPPDDGENGTPPGGGDRRVPLLIPLGDCT